MSPRWYRILAIVMSAGGWFACAIVALTMGR